MSSKARAIGTATACCSHRVAISSSRLIAIGNNSVTFKVKDYRVDGPARYTTMTVHPHEFIRRLLIHVFPKGFHRIRHYGLLANSEKDECLAKARELLRVKTIDPADDDMRREVEHDAVAPYRRCIRAPVRAAAPGSLSLRPSTACAHRDRASRHPHS